LIVTENCVKNTPPNQDDILFHDTGGMNYTLGNDWSDEVAQSAGVGEAYRSISLKKFSDAGESLIENIALGQPGEPFDGEVGMKFTATKNARATALGRFWFVGNTGSHKLTLYDAATSGKLAEATVDMASGAVDYNGFKYAVLSNPVTLKAGSSYVLTSEESASGDIWLDRSSVAIANGRFEIDGHVTKTTSKFEAPKKPGAGHLAGPVNLLFK
jgi:hypothetical protein